MQAPPKCKMCSNTTLYSVRLKRFLLTCSRKCRGRLIATDPVVKEKKRLTCLKKYGVDHHTQNSEFKNKLKAKYPVLPGSFGSQAHKDSIIEKYGVNNVFQSEEIKAQIKSINLARYGVENPNQRTEIKEKIKFTQLSRYQQNGFNPTKQKQTMLERYGVNNPQQVEQFKIKTRKTNLKRYGAPAFNPTKQKQTMLERYGVEHALQSPEIFEKAQRAQVQSRYKLKSFTSPSGKVIWYQGYEKFVIEYFWEAGIAEEDLTNIRYEVPTIKYMFGKQRTYFPDIFIRSKNMLIEVKSSYTFDREITKNLAKQQAALELGYQHLIIIWSPKNNCIDQIIRGE